VTVSHRISGEERRAQLLDVALRLFAEQGYDGTSTRSIAAAAGVTEGLIFRYFPTKRELLGAVIERHAPRPEPRDLKRQFEGKPIQEALLCLLVQMADWFWENRPFIRMVLMESFHQGEAFQELASLMERGPEFLRGLLEQRAAGGEIRLPDPAAAAEMLAGALFTFFLRHQHRGEEEWRRLSRHLAADMIRHLLLPSVDPHCAQPESSSCVGDMGTSVRCQVSGG
jgi:AcrR family transcriptional regulator